jgi:hypothetical protein
VSAPAPNRPDPDLVLAEAVYAGGRSKPFGELTLDEVRARADELRDAAGWGPTARVMPVAMAWRELSRQMEADGAQRVADMDRVAVAERAQALWIVPPGGSLLR